MILSPKGRGLDTSYAVRVISDLVPYPFFTRGIIAAIKTALELRGFDPVKLSGASGVIIDALRLALVTRSCRRCRLSNKTN